MSEIPSSIKVGPFDVRIIKWTHAESQAQRKFGEWSHLECAIRIDAGLQPMIVLDTLIHEINHAIYWIYGIYEKDDEERIVRTMATAWIQIYRDNPDLLRFIRESTSNPIVRQSDESTADMREILRQYIPAHSGSCCEMRDGKLIVTKESCKCADLHKRARELTQQEPYDV